MCHSEGRHDCPPDEGLRYCSARELPHRTVVVFDLAVTANSPAGSCVLSEIRGLAGDFEVAVFSDSCDAMLTPSIKWFRVPLPSRPVFLRYWLFQVLAVIRYAFWRLVHSPPSLIQTTQGQFVWPDVAYAHFCHRAYLRNQWGRSNVRGLRRGARWMNHAYNAFAERRAFAYARKIVVPSHGLARELASVYPEYGDKIEVIANPVDVQRFSRPPDFDRHEMQLSFGVTSEQMVFSFLALGDFSRKGLDVVIDAFTLLSMEERELARVLIIGGQAAEIREYKNKALRAGVGQCFKFVGFQRDPRPYLWASDVFVFPSIYEVFSLAILQAAAAGLPVIVTEGLYGAEEFVVDGENGWFVPRTGEGVCNAIRSALETGNKLALMSNKALKSVEQYGLQAFEVRWRELYRRLVNS